MLPVLRNALPFRRLFLAHTISRAGDAFNTVALVVLIFDLTGSGIGVGGRPRRDPRSGVTASRSS